MKISELFTEAVSTKFDRNQYILNYIKEKLIGKTLVMHNENMEVRDSRSMMKLEITDIDIWKRGWNDYQIYVDGLKKMPIWHNPSKKALMHPYGDNSVISQIKVLLGANMNFSVSWSENGQQSKNSLGVFIDMWEYDNNFKGGLLHHLKSKKPILVGPNANSELRMSADIINSCIQKNTDIITCQRALIERDLDEYAE